MDSQHLQLPVLIIGAGPAGLALAHGLKKADPPVPFRIFERDTSASLRAQGYRIRVNAEDTGLRRLLPDDVWESLMATSVDVPGGFMAGSKLNALTCEPEQWTHPMKFPRGPGAGAGGATTTKTVNVDRTLVRNVLMSGLEEHISFGKRVESYDVAADGGSVQVRFDDGSAVTGSVLVGADGIRSKIRRQLLPDLTVLDTEGRAVLGKTFLTPELEKLCPPEALKGLCVFQEPDCPHVRLLTDVMRFDPELGQTERSRFGVPSDYIYWVLVVREDALGLGLDDNVSKVLSSSTSVQPLQQALGITKSWHESIRVVLEKGDVESTAMIAFWGCQKDHFVSQWEGLARTSPPVTLIGDAGHPVPPVGAMGLHMAWQDAAELCDSLTGPSRNAGATDKLEAVRIYEASMVERAKASIERSLMGAGNFFGMRPIDELKPVSF